MTVISHRLNFVFIHIPNCGGTSVEIGWSRHQRWGDFVIGGSKEGEIIQASFQKIYGIAKHTTALRMADAIGHGTFAAMRSMAIIRPPLEMVESEYRYGLSQWRDFLREYYLNHRNVPDALFHFEREAREALKEGFAPIIPPWWYHHNRGTIPAAILSDSFDEFLERVADDRWRNAISSYLTDAKGNIMVSDLFRLKEQAHIVDYMCHTIGLTGFEMPWENRGLSVPLEWRPDLRRTYTELCREDMERFGFEIDV